MSKDLPENARYIAIIAPKEDELGVLLSEMKRQLRDYPDRPLVVVVYRKAPE